MNDQDDLGSVFHAPPPSHGREGSDAAVQLLLLLHRHTDGLPLSAMCTLTGLPRDTVDQALVGLKSRHRVTCIGRTTVARWLLAQHAPQPDAAAQGARA